MKSALRNPNIQDSAPKRHSSQGQTSKLPAPQPCSSTVHKLRKKAFNKKVNVQWKNSVHNTDRKEIIAVTKEEKTRKTNTNDSSGQSGV